MGFYATASENRVGKSASYPLKNRVMGLDAFSFSRTGSTWSETQCSRPENDPTATTAVSGMRFYGYRFYYTVLGRWLSRDPIQEWGGINVYGFAINSPISRCDILGLADAECPCTDSQIIAALNAQIECERIAAEVHKNCVEWCDDRASVMGWGANLLGAAAGLLAGVSGVATIGSGAIGLGVGAAIQVWINGGTKKCKAGCQATYDNMIKECKKDCKEF